MLLKKDKTYILAGATGTEILRRGYPTKLPLWSAEILFSKPEVLVEIYRDYIRAGADIITTNTFRTQRYTLKLAGLENETERINTLAVDLAVEARKLENAEDRVLIAASVTTLEDCYRPDLVPEDEVCVREHSHQINLLANLPVDFLLLETFNTIREAVIAAKIAQATNKPFVASFTANSDGEILSGESWKAAADALIPLETAALLVNCVPPEIANRSVTKQREALKGATIPFGVYANGFGHAGSDQGWDFSKGEENSTQYVHSCEEWKQAGATLIGGCCGTTPQYTEAYARLKK
ncbi:MAG: hypothetical protein RIQ56_306 [Candidatus Parcubacteria bacterium]